MTDPEEYYLEESPLTTKRSISFPPPIIRSGVGTTSSSTYSNIFSGKKKLKGPLRVFRLCILGILLPCIIAVCILYLRYRVYVEQLYPLAVSDMRMLDNRMSTTWCQRQRVKVNNSTKFNAFLLPKTPSLSSNSKPVSMVRHLVLEDDTKEYWGFYLLRGSTVTISTCARWPGASLIVIRGHKHLHECAYIGDNSSEELDELIEAIEEGAYTNTPDKMKRHREEVEFHHPDHKNGTSTDEHKLKRLLDTSDITDSVMLKKILEQLYEKASRQEGKSLNGNRKKEEENRWAQKKVMEEHMHVHRNSTIAKGEKVNITSQNVVNVEMLEEESKRQQGQTLLNKQNIVQKNNNVQDSEELVKQVISQLAHLGDRGQKILTKVQDQMKLSQQQHQQQEQQHKLHEMKHNGLTAADTMGGRKYTKPAVKFDDNIDREARRRRRRDIVIQTAVELLSDTEDENNGGEEDFIAEADGIADHHAIINETTLNDMSNSEFWSSFSSSEEALLNCAGLILNLPLTPHRQCSADLTEDQVEAAYLANTITYKVPVNGYYFFVFNSENEIQPNYIRVRFNIEKTVYNVTQTVSECANSTAPCALNLQFFSNEVVVMELPVQEDQDLWNNEFVVVSECEPRTTLYIILVISVPVLVILFAFQ